MFTEFWAGFVVGVGLVYLVSALAIVWLYAVQKPLDCLEDM